MLFYFGHYGNQYILKLQAIHWKEIENSNRFMEPNPDDNPLMVDLLWSDPKGVLVTKGRLLFKEGKNVMVWVWSGCIHIYIYICTCFLLYVIMWISYPSISNSPCTDCLCALAGKDGPILNTNKVGTVHGPRYASSCIALYSYSQHSASLILSKIRRQFTWCMVLSFTRTTMNPFKMGKILKSNGKCSNGPATQMSGLSSSLTGGNAY